MSFRNVTAPLAPYDQAIAAAMGRAAPAAQVGTAQPAAAAADEPEIVELARALRNDPDLIYEYVRNNIATLPQYGSLKGPLGTVLDGCGTCVDQAELMMVLLERAGFAPKLVVGQITLTAAQLTNWLGSDTSAGSVGRILGTGGFPATITLDSGGNVVSASVGWAWVKVPLGGTDCLFDPATKDYARKAGVVPNLGTMLGYVRSDFLSSELATGALYNAAISANGIQNVNRGNVRASIDRFADSLVGALEADYPNAGPEDILGGESVVPIPLNARQRETSLLDHAPESEHSAVPASLRTTLKVELVVRAGDQDVQVTTPITFNSSDIYGRRLSLFFDASIAPLIALDGVVQRTGIAVGAGQQVRIDFTVDHPYPGIFADQFASQNVQASEGGAFVISTCFGPVGRAMVERHRRLLQRNAAAMPSEPWAEPVLGESLAMLGYTWLAQVARTQRIVDRLGNTSTVYQHAVGIVGMAALLSPAGVTGPYVDLPINLLGVVQRTGRPGNVSSTPAETTVFFALNQLSSVLESGSIEQTQPGVAAVSTVKLLDVANGGGQTIYDLSSAAVFDAVRPQLLHYDAGFLDALRARVGAGTRAILPQDGQITVNRWTGFGHFEISANADSIGALISGGYSGGFPTENVPPGTVNLNAGSQILTSSNSPTLTVPGIAGGADSYAVMGTVGDPVNPVTGGYVYSRDDLVVGSGAFPYALGFQRSYDSGRAGGGGVLGAGWRHNFDLSVAADSDGFEGMAETSPRNGAPTIAALYVLLDILGAADPKSLAHLVVASLVGQYWMELLTGNVLRVSRPGAVESFVRLPAPGGIATYNAPIGSASTLVANANGSHTLRTVDGVTLIFGAATVNPPGRINSWRSAAGAQVTFAYAAGKLTTVTSNLGRSLQLGYTGDLLTSVTDGTGRSVIYAYDSGRLVRVTDPLGKATRFEYDAGGRLARIFYPARPNVAFVANSYDSLGRVSEQLDARGNRTEVYVAGRRAELVEPSGNRHVWYFDPLGRATAEVQDYGRDASGALRLNLTTTRAYDGLSRLVRTTLPEGNRVETTYDKFSNPTVVRRVPKPGSGQTGLVQRFTYVAAAGRLNFRRVKTARDPNDNITTYDYDAATGNLAQVTLPAVSRPGSTGLVNPVQTFAYTAVGLLEREVDAEGRATAYEYDAFGNLAARTVDAGTGRLNLKTTYVPDARGDVVAAVSPRGNVAGADPDAFRTTFVYDAKRRRTVEARPALGTETSYAYDADDRVTEVRRLVAPASGGSPAVYQATSTTYTFTGQPLVVTDAAGATVTRAYDAADRLRSVTLGSGRRTTYGYDVLSRVTTVTDLVFGALDPSIVVNRGSVTRETRTYTQNGLLASSKDGGGSTTSFEYDGFDRPKATRFPGGATETFAHDANGNLLTRTTRAGAAIAATYDALDRVLTRAVPGNANAGPVAYGYAYDLTGRPLEVGQSIDPGPIAYGHDTAGRLVSERQPDGREVGYAWDEDGSRIGVTWPETGTLAYRATYARDALGRVTRVLEEAEGTRELASYGYNLLSRRIAVAYRNGTASSYTYRPNDLVETVRHDFAAGASVTFAYAYNAENAVSGRTVSDAAYRPGPSNPGLVLGTREYVANALNQYTAVAGAALSYDADGNLASDGVWTYGHDPQGRLVSASKTGVAIAYDYDAAGRRRSRTRNGIAAAFLSAGAQEVAEYNASGALVRRHVPGPGLDEPLAAVGPARVRRFNHADALGSAVAVSLGDGTVAERFAYTPYGVGDSTAGSAACRFAGQRLDPDTGLYHLRARDYSPALGRFLQPDPIGMAGGLNLYAYVENDPLNATDPDGLLSWWGTARFIGGVAQTAVGLGIGAVTGWTGIGAVAGGAIAAHGVDTAVAAWRGTETLTSQGLQAAGVPQNAANAIDLAISGTAGIAAGARIIPYAAVVGRGGVSSGGGTSLLSAAARGQIKGIPAVSTGEVTASSPWIWQAAQSIAAATGRGSTANQAAIVGRLASRASVTAGGLDVGRAAYDLFVSSDSSWGGARK